MAGGLTISIQDTKIIKGVAIILLLIHHLFWLNGGKYDDFPIAGNIYFVQSLGEISKLCVALFVFLSGYGLSVKYGYEEELDVRKFYVYRYVKLFSNYWLIWLLFMPISILWLGPSLQEAYGNHMPIKIVLDFLGILNLTGAYGYNKTWWFMSCIIVLYLLFPLILWLKRKGCYIFSIIVSIALILVPVFQSVWGYLPVFLLGIHCAFESKEKCPPQAVRKP